MTDNNNKVIEAEAKSFNQFNYSLEDKTDMTVEYTKTTDIFISDWHIIDIK